MDGGTLTALNTGIEGAILYDNIAISILMIVAVSEGLLIVFLLRSLLKTKDVLSKLTQLITILNERLGAVIK